MAVIFKEEDISDFQITSGPVINEITLRYAYDSADNKYMAALTKRNPLSQILYDRAAASLDMAMIQHTRQAELTADAILKTSSLPEIRISFGHDTRSILTEVGDEIKITHRAGLGPDGYVEAPAIVSKKSVQGIAIKYEAIMKPTGDLYQSELVTLSQTSTTQQEGFSVSYANGVATITIYADVAGNPPIDGAEITINGVKKISDKKGQVRFNLLPGRYTAYISASGYEDHQVTFSV